MENETGIVTKEMLNAFKNADKAIMVKIEDVSTTVIFVATSKPPKGFEGTTTDAQIAFNSFPGHVEHGKKAWFHTFRYGFTTDNWDALKMLLRVGDTLSFKAEPNNNQYMNDASLYNDQLTVRITRNGHSVLDRYVVTSSQCPNNSARAIQ